MYTFIIGDVGPQGLTGIPGLTVKGEKGLPGTQISKTTMQINYNVSKNNFFSYIYLFVFIENNLNVFQS